MIMFTSPNEEWMSLSEIDSRDFYMPLWTAEELQKAALVLNFDIGDATIYDRCKTFGDFARQCFYDEPELKKALKKIANAIESITSPEKLQNLLQPKENSRTRHRLLHYTPCDDRMQQIACLASPFVKEELTRQVLNILYRENASLRSMLRGFPEASSLRGWIFEVDAHGILRQGRLIQMQSLLPVVGSATPAIPSVQILESEKIDEFDSETASAALLRLGPFHKSKGQTLESIDTFYLRNVEVDSSSQEEQQLNDRLMLFQMTVSETHPVNAYDIIHVLKNLDFIHRLDDEILVFIVPKELLAKFKRQKNVPVSSPTGPESIKEIKGIGIGTASKLAKYKVFTIDQLKEKITPYHEQKIRMKSPKDKNAWDNAVKCWDSRGQTIQYAVHNNAMASIS